MYLKKFSFVCFSLILAFVIHCKGRTFVEPLPEKNIETIKSPRHHIYKGFTFSTSPVQGTNTEDIILGIQNIFPHCETSHTYSENENSTVCVFDFKEKSEISLHFEQFKTEEGYDIVYLNDQHNSMITMYHGNLGNFWTEPMTIDKLSMRFQSDGENNDYGFKIDKIRVRSFNKPDAHPDSQFVDVESRYESEHDITLGPGKSWKDDVWIKQPGAEEIQIHFSLISINPECDTVSGKAGCQVSIKIFDQENKIQKIYNQNLNLTDHWLNIKGSGVHILYEIKTRSLLSRGGVRNEYGYKIDRLRVKSVHPVQKYVSKYPLVFAHGLFGFNRVMGYEYFFRVKKYLQDKGYEVYMTEVPPVSSLQNRADHLARQINRILEESSRENGRKIDKINFIGHSMGGLDGRVLLSENTKGKSTNPYLEYKIYGRDMGDKFATFTTIGTPHHGSYIADILQGWIPNQNIKKLAVIVSTFLSSFYNYPGPTEDEVISASFELTQNFCDQFNIDHPEPKNKGIRYMAFAGIAEPSIPVKENSAEVIPVLLPTLLIIQSNPDPTMRANDGIISFKSARWNEDYYQPYKGGALIADHMNEVGQILGQTDPKFNHLEFYYYLASSFE